MLIGKTAVKLSLEKVDKDKKKMLNCVLKKRFVEVGWIHLIQNRVQW
jgi:hypothetical protein